MAGRFARQRSADAGADTPDDHQLSPDGVFANGVTPAAVAQFVLDHDEAAPIEAVAAYFGLAIRDVTAAELLRSAS